ncbi:MAG: hypothetical protein J3K34DRAFT_447614 [Monoraphidium minutum]|nr:MAG: hypothetical protein J3K34DRAFT_447614 [Monoraphidium minutum]
MTLACAEAPAPASALASGPEPSFQWMMVGVLGPGGSNDSVVGGAFSTFPGMLSNLPGAGSTGGPAGAGVAVLPLPRLTRGLVGPEATKPPWVMLPPPLEKLKPGMVLVPSETPAMPAPLPFEGLPPVLRPLAAAEDAISAITARITSLFMLIAPVSRARVRCVR